ncbi:twin-arginine translocation signal domain-containing protein [Candidatus Hydrogenedentota bacterium]
MKLNRRKFLKLAAIAGCVGCGSAKSVAKHGFAVWGGPGIRKGFFRRPRAIEVNGDEVYVIDTTGRVQVFSMDGVHLRQWTVPEVDNGTPTGISFGVEGRVLIPDTHYGRILEYSLTGDLLETWGSYGTGEEQFIYATGIRQMADGTYYISEYGVGAERVHVFDSGKRFKLQWGGPGSDPGMFSRLMSISTDEDEAIYVVDTCNHRIQRFDREGTYISSIGEAGSGAGQIKFPHDMAFAPDGSILVCEFGNHRISRFTRDGSFVASYGRPGAGLGEFNGPRGIATSDDGKVYVADTDNHRVQIFTIGGTA